MPNPTHFHPRGGGAIDDTSSVDPTAFIQRDPTSPDIIMVGAGTFIGAGSFLGLDGTVGDNTVIGEHTYIGSSGDIAGNCLIGDHVYIGNNVSIGAACVIDENVVIHDNAVIGAGTIIHPQYIVAAGAIIPAASVLDYGVTNMQFGLLGKFLTDGHALSGLDPNKSEYIWDPFFNLPVTGGKWTEVLAGTAATATNGTSIDGGAFNLVSGAAGTYKILMNPVVNLTQMFTNWQSKWFAAFRFKATAVPAAGQNATFGYTTAADGLPVGIGWDGTTSITKFQLMLNNTGVALSTIPLDTAFHTGYVWCAGTTIFGSVDGETPISMAALPGAAQSKATMRAINLNATCDAGLWLGPSTVT